MTDYFFTNIEPTPIIVERSAGHQNKSTSQQPVNGDTVSQQIHPQQPEETRIHPSILINRQVQFSILQKLKLPHTPIYRMHSILSVFVPMVEKKIPKIKAQSDQISDRDTPDKEADPRLCTSEEKKTTG